MANESRKIIIEIVSVNNSSEGGKTTVSPSSTSSSTGTYSSFLTGGDLEDEFSYSSLTSGDKYRDAIKNSLHPIKTAEQLLLGKGVFVNKAYEQAKQLVVSSVEESFSHYTKLTEDYISENNFNNAKKAMSKISGLATSALGGYATGGAIGLAIGVVSWAGNTFISETTRMNNYYLSLNATNQNIGTSRVRAGLVDNGRGTEN